MKNLLLSDDYAITDGMICPPPTVHPPTLADLLTTVSERMEPGGVLALAGAWADYLEPTRDLDVPDGGGAVVTCGDWSARCASREGDPWVRWRRGKVTLWTADLDGLEPATRSTPLITDQPMMTASQLHHWTALTGQPWIGTPGMTGNSLLVDGWSPKRARPRWQLERDVSDAARHGEAELHPRQWSTDHDGPVHGYDLNRAYYSALAVLEVARDALEPAGPRQPFDPDRGGLWHVKLEPWRDARIPDPAGYGHIEPDGSRWLTTQTMTLIHALTDAGDHGGYAVLESLTAPSIRIARDWCASLRSALDGPDPVAERAAKRVYQETWGMWARKGSRVYRPDWHLATIAQARCNLWRKIWRAGQEGDRWPVRIETDAVYYPADRPWDDAPAGFRLDTDGRQLGAFKQEDAA